MFNIYTADRKDVWWSWPANVQDVVKRLRETSPYLGFYVIDRETGQEWNLAPLKERPSKKTPKLEVI